MKRLPRVERPLLPDNGIEPQYIYASTPEEVHIREYWNIVVKRRTTALCVLFAVLMVVTYCNLTATRLYTATSTLKIESQNPTVVTGIAEMLRLEGAGQTDYYQTQITLLQSRTLAAKVIADLDLESNQVFARTRVVSPNPLDRLQNWLFGYLNTLTSSLSRFFAAPSADKNQSTVTAETGQKEIKSSSLQQRPGVKAPSRFTGLYRSFLKISPIKGTRLVDIQFSTPDPNLSQELANEHAATFIRMSLENRFELTNEARSFLDKKNAELKQKLERSENALNRFRQAHGVVSLEKGENIVVDRLVEINRQLTTARAQRIEAESLHNVVENKSTQYLSQVINQGLVPSLRAALLSLEAEKVKLSAVFKPDHPRMLDLNQQINEARRSLNTEISTVIRGIQENYGAARAKEQALQSEAQKQQKIALDMKEVGVSYAVLEEEVKVNRSLYESVLKRLSETAVANDLALSNIQISQMAERPNGPSSPNVSFNLALAAGFGSFLGIGLIFLLEYLDSTVNTPQHVWQVVGLSTLGIVPDLNSLNRRLFSLYRPPIPLLQRLTRLRLRAPQPASKELILSHHPLSIITESYRTIRTALLFSQAEKPPQVVLLTSPSQGEGKTVTALNLAIALAQEGHRVLVIDADLRKGCCHLRLGITNHRGLSNILTGNLSLEEGIRPTSVTGLSLLSRGVNAPNPSDLLGSDRMRQILNDLRPSFNFILIDSPPAIAVSDAAVISVICDGVLLVLDGRKTTAACARQALERLDAVRAPVLGVVLNGIDLRNPDYAYYTNYYGSDYGSADEPENGVGRIVEAAGHEELPDDEPLLEAVGPGTIPQSFFEQMTAQLTEAVGPMAPLIIRDQIAIFGESQGTFPKSRLKELFKTVSKEIPDERLRKHFQRSMQEQMNSFSYTDLSEGEIRPEELGPTNVPREFFDHMTSKLTEAAGPMAPLIMRDQIALLGESIETFRKNRLQELLESMCKEILNEDLRRNFSKAVTEQIRTL